MGIFDNLLAPFNTSAQDKAAQAQTAGIDQGITAFNNYAGQGRNDLTTNYTAALNDWMGIKNAGDQTTQTYLDAIGANGPAGNARAQQAFQNNPGFQFQMDQMRKQLQAQHQAAGDFSSTTTDKAIADYSQNLANTSWNQYVGNLNPGLNLAATGAAGSSGVNTGLGNQLGALDITQGNANLGADVSKGNVAAADQLAPLSAGNNLWGLGTGLLSLGTGGGATVGGNLLSGAGGFASGLFNKFGK